MNYNLVKFKEDFLKLRKQYPDIIHRLNDDQEEVRNWIRNLLSSYSKLLDSLDSRTDTISNIILEENELLL